MIWPLTNRQPQPGTGPIAEQPPRRTMGGFSVIRETFAAAVNAIATARPAVAAAQRAERASLHPLTTDVAAPLLADRTGRIGQAPSARAVAAPRSPTFPNPLI